MTNILQETEGFAKLQYTQHDPMHQWDHVLQVMEIAEYLANTVNHEVDMEVLKLAVILHDVSYINYDTHVDDSVNMATDFLLDKWYPSSEIKRVTDAMFDHSGPHRREFWEATTIEWKIVYDADKYHLALTPSWYDKYFNQFYLNETKELVQSKMMKSL